MADEQKDVRDVKKDEQQTKPGRFILDLKKTGLADRHPTQIWEFDRAIRNWTGDSARSQMVVR